MQFGITLSIALLIHSCSAFAPPTPRTSFGVISSRGHVSSSSMNMADDKVPFFATPEKEEKKEEEKETVETTTGGADATLDDTVEAMVEEEIAKNERMSNLRNKAGVDYAPWMNIDKAQEKEIRQLSKEKAAVRAKQRKQELNLSGTLYFDSQAQELGGAGLNSKIIDGDVELEWVTKKETNTKGYILKRRAAKTENFEVIADYNTWGPMMSKGPAGGVYRYLDTTASPGGYIYRVTEVDNGGAESDLSQCLVEIQTDEEQRNAVIAAVGIVVIAISAVVGGLILDPYAV